MDVLAKARYIRMSPRKVRLVIDLVRGLPVAEAEAQLTFCRKSAARPVRKLLQSAVANAEHNFKLDKSKLKIKKITADGGSVLKRWKPRAFGRATMIRKRTTHLTIVLTDGREGAKAIAKVTTKPEKRDEVEAKATEKQTTKKVSKEKKVPATKSVPKKLAAKKGSAAGKEVKK